MNHRPVCNSSDHLFVPILEVSVPLLRCIHCNVFAYQETVKQLARKGSYHPDVEPHMAVAPMPYWRRIWSSVRRNIGLT